MEFVRNADKYLYQTEIRIVVNQNIEMFDYENASYFLYQML